VYTALVRIARIRGALVTVVAVERGAADASAVSAHVVGCTRIQIVAGHVVDQVGAPLVRLAPVVSAYVVVIAVKNLPGLALAAAARVVRGAGIVIAARVGVGDVLTTGIFLTHVIGAEIVVVARQRSCAGALAVNAHVADSALVAVVARGLDGVMLAARLHSAVVLGADAAVVTIKYRIENTAAVEAVVVDGAGVGVVALSAVWCKRAAQLRDALIVSTLVAVTATHLAGRRALAQFAMVAGRADILIVAGSTVQYSDTAGQGVAAIVGTYVAVIAIQKLCVHALLGLAVVTAGAHIAVVTFGLVGTVNANTVFVA